MKIALVVLLILQAVALAGPVCGNHLTPAESMDCCEKGHDQNGGGMRDDHATNCCSTCDTGKTQILKRQDPIQPIVQSVAIEIIPVAGTEILTDVVTFQQPVTPSPPDIFLLDRSIRI
jgi:hypothetical protein